MSPFQLVYGIYVVMPLQLALHVMKFLKDEVDDENPVQSTMLKLIEAHQIKESLLGKVQKYQAKVKSVFDKRENQQLFQENDLVLQWDARREDHGKHVKFDICGLGHLELLKFWRIILFCSNIWMMIN